MPEAENTWMDYTKTVFFEVGYGVCPYTDYHKRDEFCATCMAATRAIEAAYLNGHQDGMDLATEGELTMWTEVWPTEPGHYWFYGWCYSRRKPEMFLVKVHKGGNSIVYVTSGHFMYEEEGGFGLWKEAILPEPPDLISEEVNNEQTTDA